MGRRTYLTAENMTIAAQTPGLVLAAISTAAQGSAASKVRVTRLEITQSGSTALQMIRGAMSVRNNAGTLTMAATGPLPAEIGGAASGLAGNVAPAGGTARTGTNSSADTGGTYSADRFFNFANLNGYFTKPDENGEALIIPPSSIWVVRLLAAPTTLTGWTICLDLDELG